MKCVIITVAGLSSRFNQNFNDEKILKCLYYENSPKYTLIYQLLKKVEYADKIIIVGGYKFSDLTQYISEYISQELQQKISVIKNTHFHDLSSGYSLYLGISEALKIENLSEIVFVEGDLDIDYESFTHIVNSNKNVLTFNYEPIYSNKSVVLYQNDKNEYKYLFNSGHGNLLINESFKAIFNSGQIWKFKDMELLKFANDSFKKYLIEDTNLAIVQKYLDLITNKEDIELIGLKHWVNCNAREDYKSIKNYWEKIK